MKIKRFLSLLLAVVMLACLLVGCGNEETPSSASSNNPSAGKPEEGDKTEQNALPEMVYQASFEKLQMKDQPEWISGNCSDGTTMYFGGNCLDGEKVVVDEITGEPMIDDLTGEPMMQPNYVMKLFALDMNTHEIKSFENFRPAQVPEGYFGSSYLSSMTAGMNNTLWVLEELYTYYYDLPEDFNYDDPNEEYYQYYMPGENKFILSNLDHTGNTIRTIELKQEDGFYPYMLKTDSVGNLYLCSYGCIRILNPEGNLVHEFSGDEFSGEPFALSQDQIGIMNYDENGKRTFRPIDLETKTLADPVSLPDNANRIYPGIDGYTFLFDNYGDTVFGVNAETGESEKIFSWMDCDISPDYINQFAVLQDGTVLALTRDYNQGNSEFELVTMKLVDSSTIPQKTQLTMACLWMNTNIRAEVIKFNKASTTTRINVVDYSQYNTNEDMQGGLTRLNTEILSGKIPDLLITDDIPVERYAAKGFLMDLWPLIDADPDLSRDDLMTHFFDSISTDGKLYEVFSSFSIETAIANGDYVGDRDGWTFEEMQQILDTMEPGAQILSQYTIRSDVFFTCLNRGLDQFIDWDSMTCSFDSEEFINILNFANSFPQEFDWENHDWETAESDYMRFKTGKQLMSQYYVASFDDMQYAMTTVGPNPVFVGFPSSNGTGNIFNCNGGIAISASCADVNAAWSFARQFLTEEYQKSGSLWQFPTNKNSFEDAAAKKMEQYQIDYETGEYLLDENGEKIPVDFGGWTLEDGTEFKLTPLTQAQYDQFMRLYQNTSGKSVYNQQLTEMIIAETEMFFNGEKSAKDTAALIQNKISLYLMEQR